MNPMETSRTLQDTVCSLVCGRLDLIKLTMTDLTKPTRTKVMCMITLDAHNSDVQARLVRDQVTVPTAFQWQSMLKCYWDAELDDARLKIADAVFPYGYEYLKSILSSG